MRETRRNSQNLWFLLLFVCMTPLCFHVVSTFTGNIATFVCSLKMKDWHSLEGEEDFGMWWWSRVGQQSWRDSNNLQIDPCYGNHILLQHASNPSLDSRRGITTSFLFIQKVDKVVQRFYGRKIRQTGAVAQHRFSAYGCLMLWCAISELPVYLQPCNFWGQFLPESCMNKILNLSGFSEWVKSQTDRQTDRRKEGRKDKHTDS